jgi:hypothetical protein
MIGDIGGPAFGASAKARVTFIPAMRAVLISGHSSSERRVTPLVEGGEGEGLFQARSVVQAETMESGEKTRRAQAVWTQRLAAQSAPPASIDPVAAPVPSGTDSGPTALDPACESLVDAFAYNACLARRGPKLNK